MSHHHHEYGQLRGWPHEFTRADYGDTVEPPDETVELHRRYVKPHLASGAWRGSGWSLPVPDETI